MSVWIIANNVVTLHRKQENNITNMETTQNTKFVAYLRVSTAKQGASGLGMDAQRATIAEHIKRNGGEQVAEYTDIESGTHRNRAGLTQALDACKASGATLIIAKLDRLARDVEFIFSVVNTGVNIVFCDMPAINTIVLGIFASVAQYERELISERTRKALAAKKAQGAKLGKPENLTDTATKKGEQVRRENAAARATQYIEYIVMYREQGKTLQAIADNINGKGFRTPRGGMFTPSTIRMYLDRAKANNQ